MILVIKHKSEISYRLLEKYLTQLFFGEINKQSTSVSWSVGIRTILLWDARTNCNGIFLPV